MSETLTYTGPGVTAPINNEPVNAGSPSLGVNSLETVNFPGDQIAPLLAQDIGDTGTLVVTSGSSTQTFLDATLALVEATSSETTALFAFSQVEDSVCYLRGTRILTVRGEVPVEELQIGDLAVTFRGSGSILKPICWLGHRCIDLRQHPRPNNVQPVRIRAGALAAGIPRQDLLVSPGHRLCFEGGLVCASELINSATIVQESRTEAEYWHVEVEGGHDILLADGVQAESYDDVGNRAWFENGPVVPLHAELDGYALRPCLPYAEASPALREQLVARAETMGWTRVRNPTPWLEVSGMRIEPMRRGDRYRFRLPAETHDQARLCSRTGRPRDVDPASGDRRQLGLSVYRLTLRTKEGEQIIPLDDSRLVEGFSDVEHDDGWVWRWTDGNALLDLPSLAPNTKVTAVEIAIDQHILFWIPPVIVEENRNATRHHAFAG